MVRELFTLVFSDYPGIQTIGRWAMYAGLALAVATSTAINTFFWGAGARDHDIFLFYLQIIQRSIVFSLAIIIAAILFALSRYPLRMARNTYLSSLFFSFIFLSNAAQLLIDSFAPHLYNHYVDWSECIIVAALLSVWAGSLRPERATDVSRIGFSTPHDNHLLEQLNSLNEVLGRAGHR